MWACVSTNVLSDDDDDDGRARDDDVDAIALDITLDARTTRADESADMRGKVTMDRSSLSRVSDALFRASPKRDRRSLLSTEIIRRVVLGHQTNVHDAFIPRRARALHA